VPIVHKRNFRPRRAPQFGAAGAVVTAWVRPFLTASHTRRSTMRIKIRIAYIFCWTSEKKSCTVEMHC